MYNYQYLAIFDMQRDNFIGFTPNREMHLKNCRKAIGDKMY